jgi:ABC-type bacteriocin/lantibiotic exporter with double-glycine peptidase domain
MLLDEATSALDAQTERLLLSNLLERQQRTVVFVTHRTAVVDYCDHVLQLTR